MSARPLTPVRVWRGVARRATSFAHRLQRMNGGISWKVIDRQRAALRKRRTFGPRDLEALETLLSSARAVIPMRDAAAMPAKARGGLVSVRHDMDHDVENSVRFAAWEAARGIRATYFVLHTDWYWGEDPDRPSRFLGSALRRIAAQGHEIGVHNNAVTAALRFGGDAGEHLARVVNALRREGFEITGTVAHGDDICHEASFENGEVFRECPIAAFGAPDRVIRWEDRAGGRVAETTLRPIAMGDLGLSYEAQHTGPFLYLSDTGGRWNFPFDGIFERFARGDAFLQVLAHPVWWAFQGEAVSPIATIRTAADIFVGGRRPLQLRGTE